MTSLMKLTSLLVFVFQTLFFQSAQAQSLQCQNLFSSRQGPVASSKQTNILQRLSIENKEDSSAPAQLFIRSERTVENNFENVLEISSYLLNNSNYKILEKEILEKGNLSLGFHIKDGYYLDVQYKGDGRLAEHSKFNIDRLQIIAPNGDVVLDLKKDKFLTPEVGQIQTAEHVINSNYLKGLNINIDLPLSIPGKFFARDQKFAKMARYFELYDKDNLRKVLNSKNSAFIMTHLKIKYAIETFKDALIRSPMKNIATAMVFFGAASVLSYTAPIKDFMPLPFSQKTESIVESTLNGIRFPTQNQEVIGQFDNLKRQAQKQYKNKKHIYVGPAPTDLVFDQTNVFSKMNNIWVIENVDKMTQLKKTHVVFTHQAPEKNGLFNTQYFIMEVNPQDYNLLIQFVKSQGLAFVTP